MEQKEQNLIQNIKVESWKLCDGYFLENIPFTVESKEFIYALDKYCLKFFQKLLIMRKYQLYDKNCISFIIQHQKLQLQMPESCESLNFAGTNYAKSTAFFILSKGQQLQIFLFGWFFQLTMVMGAQKWVPYYGYLIVWLVQIVILIFVEQYFTVATTHFLEAVCTLDVTVFSGCIILSNNSYTFLFINFACTFLHLKYQEVLIYPLQQMSPKFINLKFLKNQKVDVLIVFVWMCELGQF
eukprot:TRINITY_DN2951_c0_g1_i6.p1 TRINITY_DN2951_c0_g1~~TRINITY_DN2951_c0_g1_i6.p1  ORF type:complete len:240 (+),score=0.09 TRINITY_DN2951_c0_g1_i6:570-1289(+)